MPSPRRVFISYSHDSAGHKELVLRFAMRLRKDGIDAQIDQHIEGGPSEKWPRWMLNKLEWADYVLVVCTETYYRHFRGMDQTDIGRGSDWEGQLITLEIYTAKSRTKKFVPVVFRSQDRKFIPELLSDQSYLLDSEERYDELYKLLRGKSSAPLTEIGVEREEPSKNVEPLTWEKGPSAHVLNEAMPGLESQQDNHSPKQSLRQEIPLLSQSATHNHSVESRQKTIRSTTGHGPFSPRRTSPPSLGLFISMAALVMSVIALLVTLFHSQGPLAYGTTVLHPTVYIGLAKKDIKSDCYEAVDGVDKEYKLQVSLPEKSRLVGCWYSLYENIQGQGFLTSLSVRPENDEVVLKIKGNSNTGSLTLAITCLYETKQR